jgi:diguanylate cyclase (GGDEF)-like protein
MSRKILLIDDSRPIHSLVRARLADESLQILSAHSGREGIDLVRAESPDVILLDVDMPEMDGFEVCRTLKSDPATLHIPVIFLTGSTSAEQKILGLEMGAIDYILKPFDPAELRARVRSALRLKYLMDLLSRKAQIDGLTGLWNRRHFDECLSEQLSFASRHELPLSCLLLDVDHFKAINDHYGHPFGDDVLKSVANTVSDVIRSEDLLFRYGGEEFAVVAPNTPITGAIMLGERIRQAIGSYPLMHKGSPITVTVSVGVAQWQHSVRITLVESADHALYQAKRDGRNRVSAFNPILAISA